MNKMTAMKEMRLRGAIPTQKEVAELLGVRPAAVSKWECGKARPSADKLLILAKLYGCTVEDLLADEVNRDEHGNYDFNKNRRRIMRNGDEQYSENPKGRTYSERVV